MKTSLAVICLLMLSAPAISQNPANADSTEKHAIVLRDDGFYILAPDSSKIVKVASGNIIDQRSGGGGGDVCVPPPGGDDGDLTPRAEQISTLTKGVGSKQDGIALSVVFRNLHKAGVSGDSNGKQAFESAFSMVLSTLHGEIPAEWQEWRTKVEPLANGYDSQFFADVADGVADAHDVESEVNTAASDVADSVTPPTATEGEALDIGQIIALIMQILQLLRDLGIIGA